MERTALASINTKLARAIDACAELANTPPRRECAVRVPLWGIGPRRGHRYFVCSVKPSAAQNHEVIARAKRAIKQLHYDDIVERRGHKILDENGIRASILDFYPWWTSGVWKELEEL